MTPWVGELSVGLEPLTPQGDLHSRDAPPVLTTTPRVWDLPISYFPPMDQSQHDFFFISLVTEIV